MLERVSDCEQYKHEAPTSGFYGLEPLARASSLYFGYLLSGISFNGKPEATASNRNRTAK